MANVAVAAATGMGDEIEVFDGSIDGVKVRTRILRKMDHITEDTLDSWRDLERNATHGNAYLSADFVVPSLRHATPELPFLLIVSERFHDNQWQFIFLGVFTEERLSRFLPLRILAAHRPPQGYLTGLLIRSTCQQMAHRAFFECFLSSSKSRWVAAQFACFPVNFISKPEALEALARCGTHWLEMDQEVRASIRPERVTPDFVNGYMSKRSRQNYKRKLRKLSEHGDYEWRYVPSEAITEQTLQSFLDLEDTGFKKTAKTSLKSQPSQEAFFREMVGKMQHRGGVFFTEMCLDGEPIASTCNLRLGAFGFAFKLGWSEQYADYSVGVLNELQLINSMPDHLQTLVHMDSGAMPGSFMERIWPGKDSLSTGFFTHHFLAQYYLRALRIAKQFKRRVFKTKRS